MKELNRLKCKNCDKEFESIRKRRYCSPECRPSSPKAVVSVSKKCATCGASIEGDARKRYCSPECRPSSPKPVVSVSKKCATCGANIEGNARKKYCSPECRGKISKTSTSSSKKKRKLTVNQLIIEKFLKNPIKVWGDKEEMLKELSFCNLLVEKHGRSFWYKIKPVFKLFSLSWFFTDKGRKFLQIEKAKLKLDFPRKRSDYKETNNSVIKAKYSKTHKTLLDFLKDEQKES